MPDEARGDGEPRTLDYEAPKGLRAPEEVEADPRDWVRLGGCLLLACVVFIGALVVGFVLWGST